MHPRRVVDLECAQRDNAGGVGIVPAIKFGLNFVARAETTVLFDDNHWPLEGINTGVFYTSHAD